MPAVSTYFHPLPAAHLRDEEDRVHWMRRFAEMGMAVRRDEPKVWAGRRIDRRGGEGEVSWFEIDASSTVQVHLRAVLLNQIVFDLGDRQKDLGDPEEGDWGRCRRDADAVMEACTRLGFGFLEAPSSGKGVHIEVFLPVEGPQSRCHDDGGVDWRWPIALRILAEASILLFGDTLLSEDVPIHFDQALVAPNEGSRLVREFNEQKHPAAKDVKMLWHEGLGPAPPLPATREEAYAEARRMAAARGSTRPQGPIPVTLHAETLDTRWVSELTGRPCPVSTACYSAEWGACEGCPAMSGDLAGPTAFSVANDRRQAMAFLSSITQEQHGPEETETVNE